MHAAGNLEGLAKRLAIFNERDDPTGAVDHGAEDIAFAERLAVRIKLVRIALLACPPEAEAMGIGAKLQLCGEGGPTEPTAERKREVCS